MHALSYVFCSGKLDADPDICNRKYGQVYDDFYILNDCKGLFPCDRILYLDHLKMSIRKRSDLIRNFRDQR